MLHIILQTFFIYNTLVWFGSHFYFKWSLVILVVFGSSFLQPSFHVNFIIIIIVVSCVSYNLNKQNFSVSIHKQHFYWDNISKDHFLFDIIAIAFWSTNSFPDTLTCLLISIWKMDGTFNFFEALKIIR